MIWGAPMTPTPATYKSGRFAQQHGSDLTKRLAERSLADLQAKAPTSCA